MKRVAIISATTLSVVHQITAQHNQDDNGQQNDSSTSTLTWCIPMIAVVLVFTIITAVIVFTVYRQKKYGAFCCFMPKMRYRVSRSEEERGETVDRTECPSPPPSYNVSDRYIIAPPVYRDALQDILLDSGVNNNSTSTVPSDSRYTMWSNNIIINGTPPAYSAPSPAATTSRVSNSEQQEDITAVDGEETINSPSYTPTSTPSLTLVSSLEQITGDIVISPHSLPSTDKTSRVEINNNNDSEVTTPLTL